MVGQRDCHLLIPLCLRMIPLMLKLVSTKSQRQSYELIVGLLFGHDLGHMRTTFYTQKLSRWFGPLNIVFVVRDEVNPATFSDLYARSVLFHLHVAQRSMSDGFRRNGIAQTGHLGPCLNGPTEALTAGSQKMPDGKTDATPKIKKERNLKRHKKIAAQTIVPEGMTYLESRSVKQPTILDYSHRYQEFLNWCHPQDFKPVNAQEMDHILIEFLQQWGPRHQRWNPSGSSSEVLPAPDEEPPKSSSWTQRMATCSSTSSTNAYTAGSSLRHYWQDARDELQGAGLSAVLPIPDLPQARRVQLFEGEANCCPSSEPEPGFQILGRPPGSKRRFDSRKDGHVLDSDPWIQPVLQGLQIGKKPESSLWNHSHAQLRESFNKSIARLGLQNLGLTLYSLRHGGASHDVLSRRRHILEVKQRGCWASDASLKRYVKEARLQSELNKVPLSVREYGSKILQNLPSLLSTVT